MVFEEGDYVQWGGGWHQRGWVIAVSDSKETIIVRVPSRKTIVIGTYLCTKRRPPHSGKTQPYVRKYIPGAPFLSIEELLKHGWESGFVWMFGKPLHMGFVCSLQLQVVANAINVKSIHRVVVNPQWKGKYDAGKGTD